MEIDEFKELEIIKAILKNRKGKSIREAELNPQYIAEYAKNIVKELKNRGI